MARRVPSKDLRFCIEFEIYPKKNFNSNKILPRPLSIVTYASISSAVLAVLAIGNKVSLFILGYLDWLKVKMRTLKPEYFLIIFCVSSSVLNEFIRIKGTSVSNF